MSKAMFNGILGAKRQMTFCALAVFTLLGLTCAANTSTAGQGQKSQPPSNWTPKQPTGQTASLPTREQQPVAQVQQQPVTPTVQTPQVQIQQVSVPTTQSKSKVAVYVTGGKTANENQALGARITHALVSSGQYRTIERSDIFLDQVAKEMITQRSGAIDDKQISELGRRAGADFVCIGEIVEAFGAHQISARIVNVVSVEVIASGLASGQLRTMEDLATLSNQVVTSLLGLAQDVAPVSGAVATVNQVTPTSTPVATQSVTAPVAKSNSNTFTDTRDGKKYRTVRIGNQTWMAENLNFERGGSWCYGGNNANCTRYGRLYNWDAAAEACPEGWHLPDRNEWNDMVKAAGGDNAATRLKARSPGWDGTNELAFSALPGGGRDSYGNFFNVGSHGGWWSSSHGGDDAWDRGMSSGSGSVGEFQNNKSNGYSVRCVRD